MHCAAGGVAEGPAAAAAGLKGRKDIGALVLRGAGRRAFCSGVDLKFVQEIPDRAAGCGSVQEKTEAFFRDMTEMPFPTIAMLFGHCHGGGVQLAASADFRFGDV